MIDYDTWKMIPDTDNKYEVCNRGIVRRIFYRKDGSVRTRRELHPTKNAGALRVWLKRYGKYAYFCVHRLVAEAFIDDFDLFDLKQRVKHIDGNIYNNFVSNLRVEIKEPTITQQY